MPIAFGWRRLCAWAVQLWCALCALLFAFAQPVHAQTYVPSTRIGTAALISPATADAFFNQPWTEPPNLVRLTTTPDEINELSRALHGDPDLVYEFIRNNVETTWM